MKESSGIAALTIVVAMAVAASSALAHQGVKNPAVKARMDAMSAIGQSTKHLGQMAKGVIAFDAAAAQAAAAEIARKAERTPDLFTANEDDPVSEASDEIWSNFDDFTERSDALREAALAATDISSKEELRPALAAIGAACSSCHEDYRE